VDDPRRYIGYIRNRGGKKKRGGKGHIRSGVQTRRKRTTNSLFWKKKRGAGPKNGNQKREKTQKLEGKNVRRRNYGGFIEEAVFWEKGAWKKGTEKRVGGGNRRFEKHDTGGGRGGGKVKVRFVTMQKKKNVRGKGRVDNSGDHPSASRKRLTMEKGGRGLPRGRVGEKKGHWGQKNSFYRWPKEGPERGVGIFDSELGEGLC